MRRPASGARAGRAFGSKGLVPRAAAGGRRARARRAGAAAAAAGDPRAGRGATGPPLSRYTTCYNMCTQRSPYNWSEQLYQRHGETICDYLSKTVLPALKQKSGNALLTELTVRWSNHKIMNKWMRLFFMYLDRYYVKHHSLPTSAAPRPFLRALPPRSRARTIAGSTSRGSSTSRRSSTTR